MGFAPTTRLQRGAGHLSSGVGDETVVLSDEGVYYGLEGIGGAVWGWLSQPLCFDELVVRVCQEFGVDEETGRQDLEAFVGCLLETGLVQVV